MIDQKTAPYAALILRITMGIMFLAHGFLKLLVFTPAGTAQFFESIGLPGWFGEFMMVGEIAGGLALVVGFYARYVALLFILDLLGAIFFVHGANGWGFSNKGGGWEYPAFWAVALLVQFLLGDGPYAIKKSECGCVAKRAEPGA